MEAICGGRDAGNKKRHTVLFLFATKAIGGEILPCVLPLHPHGQASLLRSHAGGLSVVSSAKCMLYAASEVSVFHRQAVLQSTRPHLPYHHYPSPFLSNPRSTVPLCPLSTSFHAGTVSGVLVLYSLFASSSPNFTTCKCSMQITLPQPAPIVHTDFH